jgi:hypothetical protein
MMISRESWVGDLCFYWAPWEQPPFLASTTVCRLACLPDALELQHGPTGLQTLHTHRKATWSRRTHVNPLISTGQVCIRPGVDAGDLGNERPCHDEDIRLLAVATRQVADVSDDSRPLPGDHAMLGWPMRRALSQPSYAIAGEGQGHHDGPFHRVPTTPFFLPIFSQLPRRCQKV